ncbi:hypothetical protein K1719_000726 [Acacia pycnantha]|nr:hypothetical protein K1719_000726 [Acacia pycnantha]
MPSATAHACSKCSTEFRRDPDPAARSGRRAPELYKETNREDPKAVLDGVAVAGLVGILRQLGDLAEI